MWRQAVAAVVVVVVDAVVAATRKKKVHKFAIRSSRLNGLWNIFTIKSKE